MKENEKFYKWFDCWYKIRHKWCTKLTKNLFLAGIFSLQKSEYKQCIGFKAKKVTILMQFYKIFQNTERWKKREIDLEFYSKLTSNFRIVGLLKHVSKVYIATLYRDFKEEFKTTI